MLSVSYLLQFFSNPTLKNLQKVWTRLYFSINIVLLLLPPPLSLSYVIFSQTPPPTLSSFVIFWLTLPYPQLGWRNLWTAPYHGVAPYELLSCCTIWVTIVLHHMSHHGVALQSVAQCIKGKCIIWCTSTSMVLTLLWLVIALWQSCALVLLTFCTTVTVQDDL